MSSDRKTKLCDDCRGTGKAVLQCVGTEDSGRKVYVGLHGFPTNRRPKCRTCGGKGVVPVEVRRAD